MRQNLSWPLSEHSKTLLLQVFILKPTEGASILLKNGTRDFQNSPPFKRLVCFYVITSESFQRFQLTLKQIFGKRKPFFKKLEYHFLAETTKIKNTPFPFKTALSEANLKTNRIMATTKWTYHK